MAANLLVCASQEAAARPYRFRETGIHVYTLEEMLYHCFREWKQSVDDVCSDEMTDWVQNALGLSLVAAKMRAFAAVEGYAKRLLAFLGITDYISPAQLDSLKQELAAWEKRLEWERLKERADDLLNHDDAERAALLYKKALGFAVNAALLNNLGIAHMAQGQYAPAVDALEQAVALEPENVTLLLHLAEALILYGEYSRAQAALAEAERLEGGETADVLYFKGEIQFYSSVYTQAVSYYEQAAALCYNPQYLYRLSDAYVKLRQFDKALDALADVREKDKAFLKQQAEVYVQAGNVPAAIKCMERALLNDKNSVDVWIRLARYHRLDYDLDRASKAVVKALGLAPENPKALLEHARIRNAQGSVKDYQSILHKVLAGFKNKYRENAALEVAE